LNGAVTCMLCAPCTTDVRFSRQIEVAGRPAWDGAAKQAAAAWRGGERYDPIVANPAPDFAAAAAAANNLAQHWRSAEALPQPYYQPGTTTLRGLTMDAPASADAALPMVNTLNALPHGPSLFEPMTEADMRPLPQYAPVGDLLAEPLQWDVRVNGVCGCACPYANSMAQLFMEPYNAVKVRTMLVEAGLVELSPALAALDASNACSCAILVDGYPDFAAFGMQFADTSAWTQPAPIAQINFYNTMYVSRVIAAAREQVTMASVANYARAADARAYLQAWPTPELRGGVAYSEHLPEVLHGTGCEVVPTDELYATYGHTAPLASAANRAAFECLTGIPVNTPMWRGDFSAEWETTQAATDAAAAAAAAPIVSNWKSPDPIFEPACAFMPFKL
jgi:hypothetical protein